MADLSGEVSVQHVGWAGLKRCQLKLGGFTGGLAKECLEHDPAQDVMSISKSVSTVDVYIVLGRFGTCTVYML